MIKKHLQYMATCVCKDKIWIANFGFNGLFIIDKESLEMEFVGHIPFLEKNTPFVYGINTLVHNEKMFFFPNLCNHILVNFVEENLLEDISIKPINGDSTYASVNSILIDNKIWIFPLNCAQGIYILDIETLSLEVDYELTNLMMKFETLSSVYKKESSVISITSTDNKLLEVDIEKKEIIFEKEFQDNKNLFTVHYDGKDYWILLKDSTDIYQWNKEENTYVRYELLKELEEWIAEIRGIPYSDIIFFGDEIILINYRLKYIMKINKKRQCIEKAIEYPEGFKFLLTEFNGWCAFSKVDIIDHKLWIHPFLGNMLLIFDVKNNTIEGKELYVTAEQFPFLLDCIEMKKLNMERDDTGNLESFLYSLKKKDN